MFRDALRADIRAAIERAAAAGRLPGGAVPAFEVEVPRDRRHGDYATNAALILAKAAGANPREVAARLIDAYAPPPDRVASLEVAGPGSSTFGSPGRGGGRSSRPSAARARPTARRRWAPAGA